MYNFSNSPVLTQLKIEFKNGLVHLFKKAVFVGIVIGIGIGIGLGYLFWRR